MPIDITCSACSKRFRLKDELAGKRFKCKGCGEILTATPTAAAAPSATPKPKPKKSASATPPADSPAPRKKKKRPKQELDPIPDPFADDYEKEEVAATEDLYGGDDDLDDFGGDYGDVYGDDYSAPLPKKKKKKKKSAKSKGFISSKKKKSSSSSLPPMTFNVNQINIALLIVGGILLFMGFREMRLAFSAGSAPTEISLAEIQQNGAGDNVYLTVTGIFPASEDGFYVATENQSTKYMPEVWYACVPEGGAAQPKFIVYSTDAHSEDAVENLMIQTTQTGMLINSVKGLDRETKSLLKQEMPEVDVDNCLIFHEGRSPAGFIKWAGFLLGGLVLIAIGLGWIFFLHEG